MQEKEPSLIVRNPDTLWRLADAKCAQLKDATTGARMAFLIALLWGFIWFTAIYNHDHGYTNQVLDRYDVAVAKALAKPDQACSILTDDGEWVRRHHVGLSAYLKGNDPFSPEADRQEELKLLSEDDRQKKLAQFCRDTLWQRQQALVADQISYWKIGMPGIGVAVTVFDMGVIGQLGLLIILLWLYFGTRRENEAVRSFVDFDKELNRLRLFPADYVLVPRQDLFSSEHYVYAYQAVAHRFLFLLGTKAGPALGMTILLFLFPAAVCGWNLWTDFRDISSWPDVIGMQGQYRTIIATIGFVFVCISTWGAIRRSIQTSILLNGWRIASRDVWSKRWDEEKPDRAPKVRVYRHRQEAETLRLGL